MSLKGEYNATIAKLLLGKHGYHDQSKSEVIVTEKDPTKRKSRIKDLLSKTTT